MAKRHETEEQTQNVNGSEPTIFNLIEGEYDDVQSRILSLHFPDASGNDFVVPQDQLRRKMRFTKNGVAQESDVHPVTGEKLYRFEATRYLPFPKAVQADGSAHTKDSLLDAIGSWMYQLEAYESADKVRVPAHNGQAEMVRDKGKLLVTKDGSEAISVARYVLEILLGEHKLRSQKIMYAKLNELAEKTMRRELGIEAPISAKKPRKSKEAGEIVIEEQTSSEVL